MSQTDARAGRSTAAEQAVDRSLAVIRSVRGQPSALLVTAVVTAVYLAAYLVALGHLAPGSGAMELTVVADPLSRSVERVSLLSFEPVALLELGAVSLQVAPVKWFSGWYSAC